MDVRSFRIQKLLWAAFLFLFLIGCTPAAQPTTIAAVVEPILVAVVPPVEVTSPNQPPSSLQKDQTVLVKINDVMRADKLGRGLVRFEDRVEVDLFRESEFRVTEVKSETGNFLSIGLEQLNGHIRVKLSDNANARVRLVTSIATVNTLRAGTDFVICHNPVALSCVVALSGEVEVVGQGKVVTIKGGEATYMLKGEQPSDPICSHPDEVSSWMDQKLSTGEVESISKVVARWDPQPCSAATQNAAVKESSALPSPDGMVNIPEGEYSLGSAAPNKNQAPLQKVTLPAYWIDQYEVTNNQYQVFINESGHAVPSVWPGDEMKPVQGITYNDATAYCAWARKRLPNEAEWEAAARGPGLEPPLYPWGNDNQAGGKVYDLPLDTTYPVGKFDFNKSPFEIYDMAGNVWEWVDQPYAQVTQYAQILRGGRYGFLQDMAHREQVQPNDERFVSVAGFRCAADQVEEK